MARPRAGGCYRRASSCARVAGRWMPLTWSTARATSAGLLGIGQDRRVWAGTAVADIVADNERLTRRWRQTGRPSQARTPALDQLAREALLALSSDWAFMISKDSAAGYARARHDLHHRRFQALADAIDADAATDPITGVATGGAVALLRRPVRPSRCQGPGVAGEQLGVPGRAPTYRPVT